jgi:hypothetical protein
MSAMRFPVITAALLFSSSRAFAWSWPECEPLHLRFLA